MIEGKDEEDEREKKKRRRDEAEAGDDKTQRAQSNGDIGETPTLVNGNADLRGSEPEHGSHGEQSKKTGGRRLMWRKEWNSSRRPRRNLVGNGQHYEDTVKLAENENAGKKKKMMVETEEMSNLDRKRKPRRNTSFWRSQIKGRETIWASEKNLGEKRIMKKKKKH